MSRIKDITGDAQIAKTGDSVQLKGLSEQLFHSPKVINLNVKKAVEQILDLITKTAYKSGQNVYKTDLGQSRAAQELMLAKTLYDEICLDQMNAYRWITLREMQIAFNQGLKGRYGEYFGLNIKTFCQWMDGFKEKDRNDEMAKLKKNETQVKPLQINRQIDHVKAVQDEFKAYKETGTLSITFPIAYYGWLVKSGHLKQPDKAERTRIYNEQKALAKEKADKDNQIKRLIDRTVKAIMPSETTIQNRCKAYVIKRWFDKSITDKIEPADILTQ